ncbi:MAG: hypothetical protein NW218_15540 [Saprospiraceae bacterium]|nr:hypothetical protein [Saprospiraceae bacterium]
MTTNDYVMIYVFKTSVKTKKAVKQLTPKLNDLLPSSHWNFDLEDCDHILRIASKIEISEKAIKLLQDNGFDCVELTD